MSGVTAEARRWVDAGGVPPEIGSPAVDRDVALAWAIKDACYAAWSSEPQRTGRAASALAALFARARGSVVPAAALAEIEALARWSDAIAELTRGHMQAAIGSLDRAAALFESIGRPGEAAQTRVPRIMALTMLGQHEAAVQCAEQAQSRFVALGDRRAAAKVSLNLGSLHLRHDAYADAAHHYRAATVLFARIADREHSVMADIGVADAVTALGDFDEAARIYARARMRAATHGFPVLEALVDESMALLDLARGHFQGALSGLARARSRYVELAMPQHLAIAEKQLADAYLELRLLPEALALYGPALARFEALQMPDDQAWTLAQRGRAEALSGDRAAAAASFEEAAALFVSQGSGVGELAVGLARAELALAEGDAVSAITGATRAGLGLAEAGLAEAETRAGLVIAEALLQQGESGQAAAHFARLLLRARALKLHAVEVRCLTGTGLAALAEGRVGAARDALHGAVERFEEQRRMLPGDDIRRAFLTDHLRPFEALLRLALCDHAAAATPAHAAEVLRWLDRYRAGALGERLLHGGAFAEDAAVAPEIGAMRDRLDWLQRRVGRLHDEGDAAPELEARVRHQEAELLEAARRHRLSQPALTLTPSSVAYDDIAQQLPIWLGDGDALIEYGVIDGSLFACVVRRDGIQVRHALARSDEVMQAVRAARFQIDTLRHGATALAAHLPRLTERAEVHLQRLYRLLWAPLEDAVAGCRRLLIVAPAPLVGLPFAALHDGRAALGERHPIAMGLSARLACHALQRPPPPIGRSLVVGDSSRLAHAEAEARAVAAVVPRPTLLLGAQACVVEVEAHAMDADLIHLACHAVFRSDNPMFSTLQLVDGALSAERIEALRLRPAIVVLSACETGLADGGPGDEHIGLVRAFFVAGAARVVASLWPVDDAVTVLFMAHFYRHLCAGDNAAAALQQAQQGVRASHPHPCFWAAFALHGAW